MKKTGIIALAMIMMTGGAHAADKTITSPDGKVQVVVSDSAGLLTYSVGYDGKEMLKPSDSASPPTSATSPPASASSAPRTMTSTKAST